MPTVSTTADERPPVPDPDYVVRDLTRMSRAENYQRWQFDLIAEYLGQRILEVGCGIGNFTEFLADRELAYGIDIEPECVAGFRERFAGKSHLQAEVMDVLGPEFLSLKPQGFDTVVCLNVLEHIQDDVDTLRKFHAILRPKGRVALIIPAFSELYGPIDRELGHFRRYTKDGIEKLSEAAGFGVVASRYFNFVGGVGWWVNAKVIPRREQSATQIAFFDSILVPLIAAVEKVVPAPFGQSVLCVLEKA